MIRGENVSDNFSFLSRFVIRILLSNKQPGNMRDAFFFLLRYTLSHSHRNFVFCVFPLDFFSLRILIPNEEMQISTNCNSLVIECWRRRQCRWSWHCPRARMRPLVKLPLGRDKSIFIFQARYKPRRSESTGHRVSRSVCPPVR